MTHLTRSVATVVLSVLIGKHSLAQSGNTDGPITARAYDALYVAGKMREFPDITREIAKIWDSPTSRQPIVLSFIQHPDSFIAIGRVSPNRAQLDSARRIADAEGSVKMETLRGELTPASGTRAYTRESAFIFGLTDFVIARTKAELTSASFRQAKRWFKRSADLRAMFPQTVVLLDQMQDVDPQAITQLRTAAREDLDKFPTSAWKIARSKCHSPCQNAPERVAAIDALRTGAALSESFIHNDSPILAFKRLGGVSDDDFYTRAGRLATRAAAITAGEIAPGGGRRFVAPLDDTLYVSYVAALVADTLFIDADTALFARDAVSTMQAVKQGIAQMGNAARAFEDVYQEFNDMREARSQPLPQRRERYAALARSFADAVAELASLGQTFVAIDLAPAVLAASGPSTQPPAIAAATQYVQFVKNTSTMASALADKDYVTTVAIGLAIMSNAGMQRDSSFEALSRWAQFAGGISTAKDPDEVAAVLEQFALPPASYIGKRFPPSYNERTRVSVHLNAYLGISGGGEWLNSIARYPISSAV